MTQKCSLGKIIVSGGRSERVFTFKSGSSEFILRLEPEEQQDFYVSLIKLKEAGFVHYNGSELNPTLIMAIQSSDPDTVTNDQVKIRFLKKVTNHEIGSGLFCYQDIMDLQKRLTAPDAA